MINEDNLESIPEDITERTERIIAQYGTIEGITRLEQELARSRAELSKTKQQLQYQRSRSQKYKKKYIRTKYREYSNRRIFE